MPYDGVNAQNLLDPEQFTKLRERVDNAFSESERVNNEKVSQIKNNMLNRTITSILQAETQNDKMIKDMLNSIPRNNEQIVDTSVTEFALAQLSSDFAAQE